MDNVNNRFTWLVMNFIIVCKVISYWWIRLHENWWMKFDIFLVEGLLPSPLSLYFSVRMPITVRPSSCSYLTKSFLPQFYTICSYSTIFFNTIDRRKQSREKLRKKYYGEQLTLGSCDYMSGMVRERLSMRKYEWRAVEDVEKGI